LLGATSLGIFGLFGTAALAQVETDPAQANVGNAGEEEIVVTAQRREQSLQDVPISLRALAAEELARTGADDLQGFAGFAPGLALVEQGPSRTQINMRGVSTGDNRFDRAQLRETVGLYLDDTPISTQVVSPNLGLLDIQRIEVLRGPQGTLYGAGSLSGTVRMITRRPSLEEFELNGDVTVSSTENGETNYQYGLVLNQPLVRGVAAVRAAGFYRQDGGFIDNTTTGEENFNDAEEFGGRVSLRVEPTTRLSLNASLVHQETDLGGDFSYRAEAGDLEDTTPISEPSSSRMSIGSLVAAYDFGPVGLTSATSFFAKETQFGLDIGGFSEFLTGFDDDFVAPATTRFDQEEFTQELRLSSSADGGVIYSFGAFFQHQDNSFGQDVTYPGIDAEVGIDSTDFAAAPDQVYGSEVRLETTQIAVFGEVELALTDRLTASVGGRYFDVTQDSAVTFFGIFADPQIGTQTFDFSAEGFNPRFNMTYDLSEDHMVYAQAARGFRLGGTNEPIPATCAGDLASLGFSSAPSFFESDSLWNYELGAKTAWANGRFVVNGAAYVIDWEGPPLSVDLDCGFSTLINAGAFTIRGVEVDVEARPLDSLLLRFGASFNEAELSGDLPSVGGVDGDRVPQTPRLTLNASVDYDFPLGWFGLDGEGFVHADIRHVSERVTLFPGSVALSGYFELPAYEIVGLRAGAEFGRVSVEGFVENAFDERAVLNQTAFARAFSEIPGTAIYTNRPRTVGVRLGVGF
jgi:outer membrane receptor protein involved in Fe transport